MDDAPRIAAPTQGGSNSRSASAPWVHERGEVFHRIQQIEDRHEKLAGSLRQDVESLRDEVRLELGEVRKDLKETRDLVMKLVARVGAITFLANAVSVILGLWYASHTHP